ncbi:MAG TPA: hypothetical protein VMX12_06015 [Acidimicrobiia bacterium]|nr:hypothetical protein [Acidimicrobiia bacterium]
MANNVTVHDGARRIDVHVGTATVDLVDSSGPSSLAAAVLTAGPHRFRLVRKRSAVADGARVQLYVDDVLALDEPVTSFPASASRLVEFGARSNGGAATADWYFLRYAIESSAHNYWNEVGNSTASTSSANPDRLVDSGTPWVVGDEGRTVRVRNSAVAHGRGNGAYEVLTFVDSSNVDLVGRQHRAVDGSEPGSIIAPDRVRVATTWDNFTAEDAGAQATLVTGTAVGNHALRWTARHAGDDGNQITISIIYAAPATPQVVVADNGDGPEDIEITINPATHDALDVIAAVEASVNATALVLVDSIAPSDGSGNPPAFATTFLAGGEDGKFLTISGSLLGNSGTYLISTLLDPTTVLLGTHRAPVVLAIETGLDWRKDPNFDTDAALDWELAAGGTIGGPGAKTLTLRRSLPSASEEVIAIYTTVLSAQILRDEFIGNLGDTFYPFYLADPLAFLRQLIDAITVAGVIPRFPQ